MEKRKSLRELKSIVKGKKEELEKNIDDIVQYSDLSNPQVKEIIAKLQGEIEVMEGIILSLLMKGFFMFKIQFYNLMINYLMV